MLNGLHISTQTLTPVPGLAIGTGGLDLTATGSNIALTGPIDAGASLVVFNASGAITSNAAAILTARNVNATAVDGIVLRMNADSISAMNTGNGGIVLDEADSISISNLDGGSGGATLNSGIFQMSAGATISGGNDLVVNGALNLNGTSPTVGAVSGSGTIFNNGGPATLVLGANGHDGVFNGTIDGAISVVKSGSGAETFAGPQSYQSLTTNAGLMILNTSLFGATILNNAGTLNINADAGTSTLTVNATTHFGGGLRLGALTIGSSGLAQMAPHGQGGNPFVLDTQALTINGGGTLDLANNAMIVRGGDLNAITAQITAGLASSSGGYWNGPGINSSAAANDPLAITGLGVIDNFNFGYTNLVGVPLNGLSHDVLVRFTVYGDADLNGVLNGVDYGLTDNGAHTPGLTGWFNGDFNYSSVVDATDFFLLDNSYSQAGGTTGQITRWTGATSSDWFDPTNWTDGVPGPADTAVLAQPNGFQPQLSAATSVAFFDHVSGTFGGVGVLTVTQGLTWLGGAEGAGTTALGATAFLNLAGSTAKLLDGRTLIIKGSTLDNNVATLSLDNGATLQAGTSLAPTLHLTLLAGGGVIDTNGFNLTLDQKNSIAGVGGLTKVGAGTLTLASANSYGGTTTVNAGILTVTGNNQLSPNSGVVVNSGTLNLGPFTQTVGTFTVTGGTVSGPGGTIVSMGDINIVNGLVTTNLVSKTAIQITNGTVNGNLDAGDSHQIAINGGTVKIQSDNTTPSSMTINGGTLDIGAFTETVGPLTVQGGTITSTTGTIRAFGLLSITSGVVNANLFSNVPINVSGGTVTGNLDAADTAIQLQGGTVTIKSSYSTASQLFVQGTLNLGAFTLNAGSTVVNGGTITSTTGSLQSSGDININSGTVDADVFSSNAINLKGGTLTPHSNLNSPGLLMVNGGTLALGALSATFGAVTVNGGSITGAGTLTSGTDFLLGGGTVAAKLAGNVGVIVGPGAVVLTNSTNSFTGTVTIASGSLEIGSDGVLGDVANDLDIEGSGTLKTTASLTLARHIIANGAAPTINVAAGTVTLDGVVDGTGTLQKTGSGKLVLGSNFAGSASLPTSHGTTAIGGNQVKFTGTGSIMITIVSDGMGGTRISKVELADTNAKTVLTINGPKAPATTTIDTIVSLDPNDEIGTIKLGKTVILGSGVNDAIADVDIRGKVNRLLFNDVNSYTLFELGKGLPYDNTGDATTPDSYNNHPNIKLRTVLGTGVTIDVSGNGIAGDQPGTLGGGGLGKVTVSKWDQPGTVKTSQSIGSFQFGHGDCNVVFLVDPDHLGALTTAGIGKMLVPNGAWGSSGSIVEGNVTLFSAAQFLAAANITAGSMSKLLVKRGPYLGTTTLTNPDAPKMGTFSVNGDYQGYVDSVQALSNLNIKGTFKGSIKASSIGAISAYSFNGTTIDDGEADPLRHNIFITEGSLGTIKTSAGGIKDFEIAVATVFNGFQINWPSAPGGAVGIDHVNVAAGQINNTVVKLNGGVRNPLSYGIQDSVLESAGSMGVLISSHSVTGSIFAAASTMGAVTISADLLGSKLLAGTSLGGDGVFDGDEIYTRAGKIGDIKALGTFGTTSIAVGVDPGPGYIYGDGDDVAAPGIPTAGALGALTFGAASGGIFGPAGIIHTDAIQAATIKSLKIGSSPILKDFAISHYIRAGGSETASDVLVQIV
jgi:autotransporter-associated beta strand protein